MRMRRRAMTLIEVTLSLTVTAMIGLVTTSVMVAVLNAHETTDCYTQNVQSGRISLGNLQSKIRTSLGVTAGGVEGLTLWTHDDDDPGVINVEELAVLKFISAGGVVRLFAVGYPDSVPQATRDALNVTLDLDQVDTSVKALLRINATGHRQATTIASGLSALRFRYDESPPEARLVSINAAFGSGAQRIRLNTLAALRAPAIE